MALYERPADEVRYGDVYGSTWLIDAFLREDAVPLTKIDARGYDFAYGWVDPEKRRLKTDFALAHGTNHAAILLSDDCEIESCFKRSDPARRRLLCAAVSEWKEPDATPLRKLHLAPSGEGEELQYDGGVVWLDRLFVVRADALDPGQRILSLTEEGRQQLEVRVNAFVVRRGPEIHSRVATKFAQLLTADSEGAHLAELRAGSCPPNANATMAAQELVKLLGIAWDVEGRLLNQIDSAYEAEDAAAVGIDELLRRYEDLEAAAGEARRRLEEARRAA